MIERSLADKLRQLSGSEIEATAIAQKLNITPILGKQATEANLKSQLASANILHFATHGTIPKSDRDLNSWFALADIGSDGNGGNKLTISEIFNGNLNAQLGILSACNAGEDDAL
ncbi:MAG: CHAT domain-containing protein [Cyanobacteria bacterium P01_H01_bin.130]